MSNTQSLQHIAIIPDGNRRWAVQQGMKPEEGHLVGFEKTRGIIQSALENNIYALSFWGSSVNNLTKRSMSEVKNLYFGFKKYFTELLEDGSLDTYNVRVQVLGKWEEMFPADLKRVIRKLIDKTQHYSDHQLTFFLGYNGDVEMIEAIQSIVDNSEEKVKVTPALVKQHLYTHDLPPVDLVIRTGSKSDPHNSVGFMMWDTANSQFHYTESLYPEFTPEEFEAVIEDFSSREKRQGK